MADDDVMTELRKIKREHAEKYDYDLKVMFAALREQQAESGRQVVSFRPKKLKGKKAAA